MVGRWRKEGSLFPRFALCHRASGELLKKDCPTPFPTQGPGKDLGRINDLETVKIQLLFGSPLPGKCELSVFDYFALITSGYSLLEAVSFPRNLFCFSSLAVFWGPASSLSTHSASPFHPSPHLPLHQLLACPGNKLLHDPS